MKPSKRSQQTLMPAAARKNRGRVRVPNAPSSAPWRAAIARTRAARAAIDAQIVGVKLGRGPVMVLARTGRAPTDEERRGLCRSLLHID